MFALRDGFNPLWSIFLHKSIPKQKHFKIKAFSFYVFFIALQASLKEKKTNIKHSISQCFEKHSFLCGLFFCNFKTYSNGSRAYQFHICTSINTYLSLCSHHAINPNISKPFQVFSQLKLITGATYQKKTMVLSRVEYFNYFVFNQFSFTISK